MSAIQILSESESNYSHHFEALCGNVRAYVGLSKHNPGLCVLCMNASHRAWKGGGRSFASVALALEAYKSGEMKAIIGAAVDARDAKVAAAAEAEGVVAV